MSQLLHTVHTLVEVIAAPEPAPAPSGQVNTDGVLGFFATKIVPILLGILGIIFIGRANKGEVSKVVTSSGIAILGLAFLAGAATLFFVGDSLVKLMIK